MITKDRDISLDCIRIFAAFSVMSVHFFLNNGFYSQQVVGKRMYMMVLARSFFMICVPLFLVLTGYLMSAKKLCRKYFYGITKTLSIYVLASIACIIYKNVSASEIYGFKEGVLGILSFSAANYSWYIEMYIGLFLLIPFINLIWQGLEHKREKQILVGILVLLTAFPSVMNIWHISEYGSLEVAVADSDGWKIIPAWWTGIYPLCYFFIGCYLREFGLKISKARSSLLLLATVVLAGSFNYFISYNRVFQWGIWQGWGSLPGVIMTVLVFHIFRGTKWLNVLPHVVKRFIKWCSDLTLGAYLVSYIFDSLFYPVLLEKVPEMIFRMEYYFVIVPLVFICSMCLSAGLSLVYKLMEGGIKYILRRKHTHATDS